MGYQIQIKSFNEQLNKLSEHYRIFAPRLYKGAGAYSDSDRIEYGEIQKIEDIEFDKKSDFSFKEVLFPQSEVLFYFTEDDIKEASIKPKGNIIFLRSCDLHGVKRFDDIYLKNGYEDHYYARLREKTKFILMGCRESFENCFCVDMETNQCNEYDAYIELDGESVKIDSHWEALDASFLDEAKEVTVLPKYVLKNKIQVDIPEKIELEEVLKLPLWEEYNARCIACGRCNFVCPTCTCFTMQDIFYKENGRVGERRRVWASCHVDGYTDMAGGICFRQSKAERMRFKVMHKISDYKKRFGVHMCVGCGRCDDVCPEYISFSNSINKLNDALSKERAVK
ncbi:MAG: anaerobic sulfite reductase subunit AsrA [Eubacterium sp.]